MEEEAYLQNLENAQAERIRARELKDLQTSLDEAQREVRVARMQSFEQTQNMTFDASQKPLVRQLRQLKKRMDEQREFIADQCFQLKKDSQGIIEERKQLELARSGTENLSLATIVERLCFILLALYFVSTEMQLNFI